MATTDSQPFLLQSIRILSAVSPSVVRFCKDVPGDRTESASEQVASLLDALTYFFPTIPDDNRAFAMTLTATGEEVIATLAANDPAHLGPNTSPSSAAFPESQQSPSDILRTIWGFMTRIAKDVKNASYDESHQLIQYLLCVHALKIRHRFAKQPKELDQFWGIISADKTTPEQETSAVASFNWKQIGYEGYTYAKTSNALKSYLESAKTIYDSHKAFDTVDNVNLLMAHISLPYTCHKLEKLLSDYDKGYLVKIQKVAKLEDNKFDFIRYINRLCAPVLNILTIELVAAGRNFTTLSTLPLKIKQVTNSPSIGVRAVVVPPKDAAEFLRNTYVSFGKHNATDLSQVIQARADNAVRKSIQIAPPHCACLLVRYHERAGPLAPPPFPYIGVSKPSCFQCGIYIDAYNASNKRTSPITFSVRRTRNNVVPCLLPTISKEVDSSIAEHMMGSIRAVVTAMLDADIQTLRLSQGRSYSVGDDDELRWLDELAQTARDEMMNR